MSVLKIQDVVENFNYYKNNLEKIIKNPDLYYQSVEQAQFVFSSISEQKLYLGDLLQLWIYCDCNQYLKCIFDQSAYIFSTKFNFFTQTTQIFLWLENDKKCEVTELDNVLPIYLEFIALKRP